MAIRPADEYPGQIATDADYPHGKARNVSTPGDGTGTPWEAKLVNDVLGFEQALLAEAAITPSGNPDKVGASDYLNAIRHMIARAVTITPTTLTTGANNYAPTGWDTAQLVRLSATGGIYNLNGLGPASVKRKTLANVGALEINLPYDDPFSSTGNKVTGPGPTCVLFPGACVEVVHDAASNKWRVIERGFRLVSRDVHISPLLLTGQHGTPWVISALTTNDWALGYSGPRGKIALNRYIPNGAPITRVRVGYNFGANGGTAQVDLYRRSIDETVSFSDPSGVSLASISHNNGSSGGDYIFDSSTISANNVIDVTSRQFILTVKGSDDATSLDFDSVRWIKMAFDDVEPINI